MKVAFANRYKTISDKTVADEIITVTYNEEAAVYISFDRYDSLLEKMCRRIFDDMPDLYDDCCDDLFAYLKGNEMDWSSLRSFQ